MIDGQTDRVGAVRLALGPDGKGVWHEKLGYVLRVIFVNRKYYVEPALAGAGRSLGLDQDKRHAVDRQRRVGSYVGVKLISVSRM